MSDKVLSVTLSKHRQALLDGWLRDQQATGATLGSDLKQNSVRFIDALCAATASGQSIDAIVEGPGELRDVLEEIAREGAQHGSNTSQVAEAVFSLKRPLFDLLKQEAGGDGAVLGTAIWAATVLLDRLGLYTTEVFQKQREDVIGRQQDELLELSTPVVKLWDGVLALPLIGSLDSNRTQVVMENLLQSIVATGADIAIIDITGVPTVDTLVAQHLLKTIAAARLMGADCVISGIRPQIAQTIVHLGIDLQVVSKATMADAFAWALRRKGKMMVEGQQRDAATGHARPS